MITRDDIAGRRNRNDAMKDIPVSSFVQDNIILAASARALRRDLDDIPSLPEQWHHAAADIGVYDPSGLFQQLFE